MSKIIFTNRFCRWWLCVIALLTCVHLKVDGFRRPVSTVFGRFAHRIRKRPMSYLWVDHGSSVSPTAYDTALDFCTAKKSSQYAMAYFCVHIISGAKSYNVQYESFRADSGSIYTYIFWNIKEFVQIPLYVYFSCFPIAVNERPTSCRHSAFENLTLHEEEKKVLIAGQRVALRSATILYITITIFITILCVFIQKC